MNEFFIGIKNFLGKTANFFLKKENLVVNLLAAMLLALMFFVAIASVKDDAATSDEVAHIPAGYSYLTLRDFRLNPEHPPLIKDLSAIPLLFLRLNFPKDGAGWQNADQWATGKEFIYDSGNNADQILFLARLPMILVLIFLGWFVFFWTKKIAGARVALLAIFLYSFCPNLIAHGRLVTNDVGAALGAALSTYFWVEFLKHPSRKNIIFAGLVLGTSLLIKFSLLVLIPVFGFITIIYAWLKTNNFREVFKYCVKAVLAGVIGALLVIWPVYQFHLSGYSVGEQEKFTIYPLSTPPHVGQENICRSMISPPLLRPFSHFCAGAVMSLEHSSTLLIGWETYLLGEISMFGFWYYFPAVYFFKVPLAFHFLALIALFGAVKAARSASLKEFYRKLKIFVVDHPAEFSMLVFVLAYWLVALNSKINIGIRHLSIIFPLTYILVSLGIKKAIADVKKEKNRAIIIVLLLSLLGWYAISSLSVFPYYLTYYNELAGGPKNGYKIAVDSNYDWCQDIKRLAWWVNEQKIDKIYVDVFTNENLDYRMKGKYAWWRHSSWWYWLGAQTSEPLPAGSYLAVSATFMQEGRANPVSVFGPQGDEYRWLDRYQPVARIGNSIFVYYIP